MERDRPVPDTIARFYPQYPRLRDLSLEPTPNTWLAAGLPAFRAMPRELRDRIYEETFNTTETTFYGCSANRVTSTFVDHEMYWRSVVHKYVGVFYFPGIFEEALECFYQTKTFDLGSAHSCSTWLRVIGPEQAAYVRRIRITIKTTEVLLGSAGGELRPSTVKAIKNLKDLADDLRHYTTDLRSLEIIEWEPRLGLSQSLLNHLHVPACADFWRSLGTIPSLRSITLIGVAIWGFIDDQVDVIRGLTQLPVHTSIAEREFSTSRTVQVPVFWPGITISRNVESTELTLQLEQYKFSNYKGGSDTFWASDARFRDALVPSQMARQYRNRE
ncbi:hypothetical protein NKR23_g4992 [Pleurostoma richardsiae]|uniref:Uncharacterized protein n=1 Tax=Pleurostoma richardsiae TaxID=41990 RepID=A0AA38S0M7_9PEZI|nr:hypothetical protein NKR23_g4992 [Pleurostoma richardsiae]